MMGSSLVGLLVGLLAGPLIIGITSTVPVIGIVPVVVVCLIGGVFCKDIVI